MTTTNNTTVTPFLTVNDGIKAVLFYTAAFGATEVKRHAMPNNKLSSVMSIDGAEFFVGDEEPAFGNMSPVIQLACPVRIVLKTNQADQLFEQALQLGATPICPMTTEDDWRIGKLRDPFGHIWEIGYPLED